jgi:DNA-binding beta-propeller fold protein YncE
MCDDAMCDVRCAMCDMRYAMCDMRYAMCDKTVLFCDVRIEKKINQQNQKNQPTKSTNKTKKSTNKINQQNQPTKSTNKNKKNNKMKKKLFYAALCCAVLAAACEKDEPAQIEEKVPVAASEFYVLNEGVNGQSSTLSYYSDADSTLRLDYFVLQNSRALGDGANDLKRYGSKLYCVLTTSSRVEVMDAKSGKSLRQIELKANDGAPRQPRSIAFWQDKAYVCSWDNTVVRIDTASLNVEGEVTVGRNPDDICAAAGKLYVSNSGGLDYPNYDNTVSVVDIASFAELKKIAVGTNPYTLMPDLYGDVYVITRGNYGDEPYRLHRISTTNDELVQTLDITALSFTVAGDYAYLYDYSYSTFEAAVKVLDTRTEQLTSEQFIADGTPVAIPNGIAADPVNGNVYIADAVDYSGNTGQLLCFSPQGALRWKMGVGITPRCVVLMQ